MLRTGAQSRGYPKHSLAISRSTGLLLGCLSTAWAVWKLPGLLHNAAQTPSLAQPSGAQQGGPLSAQSSALQLCTFPPYWTSQDVGVVHYALPGRMQNATSSVAVVLHFWFKAVTGNNHLKVRGFAFAEAAGDRVEWQPGHHLAMPWEVMQWHPGQIFLKNNDTQEQHDFSVDMSGTRDCQRLGCRVKPFHLNLILKTADVDLEQPCFELRVGNWREFVQICLTHWLSLGKRARQLAAAEASAKGAAPAPAKHMRPLWAVLKPFYNTPLGMVVALVVHNVAYHLAMGLAGAVLYVRQDAVFQHLTRNPHILALIRRGHLQLWLWDNPLNFYEHSRNFDQGIVYSHAILAMWEEAKLLAPIDVDEFLASFQPGRFSTDIVRDCLGNASLAAIPRVNVRCPSCTGANDYSHWSLHDNGSPANSSDAGAASQAGQGSAADLGVKQHPLHLYHEMDKSSWDPEHSANWPKCIVDPDNAYSFFVHEGNVTDNNSARWLPHSISSVEAVSSLCGVWLHLPHLSRRHGRLQHGNPLDTDWEEDTAWQWVLQIKR